MKIEFESNHIRGVMYAKINIKMLMSREHGPEKMIKVREKSLNFVRLIAWEPCIKETLHSRHHSTVLPRLGSSRMESHQNLHTHAVDSAIQLQENNILLICSESDI